LGVVSKGVEEERQELENPRLEKSTHESGDALQGQRGTRASKFRILAVGSLLKLLNQPRRSAQSRNSGSTNETCDTVGCTATLSVILAFEHILQALPEELLSGGGRQTRGKSGQTLSDTALNRLRRCLEDLKKLGQNAFGSGVIRTGRITNQMLGQSTQEDDDRLSGSVLTLSLGLGRAEVRFQQSLERLGGATSTAVVKDFDTGLQEPIIYIGVGIVDSVLAKELEDANEKLRGQRCDATADLDGAGDSAAPVKILGGFRGNGRGLSTARFRVKQLLRWVLFVEGDQGVERAGLRILECFHGADKSAGGRASNLLERASKRLGDGVEVVSADGVEVAVLGIVGAFVAVDSR
jgi:hypothetical protein